MDQAAQSQAAAAAGGTSAFDLMWEIMRFLWTCPNQGKEHPYRMKYVRTVMENTIEAIATGQYIIIRNDGGTIRHYIAYWRVFKTDIPALCEGIKPTERCHGDTIYIVDHGNKGGRKSLTEMIGEIRKIAKGCTGACWHNWNNARYRTFLKQKGV